LEIWRWGNLKIWRFVDLEIWRFEDELTNKPNGAEYF
jgi:hypothetical protein